MALPGRIDLNALVVFDAVAETGGFTAAANRLGIATARVSVDIVRLEAALGVTLFSRTTRRVALTDAGQALYEECRPLLQGLDGALAQAGADRGELAGSLRISTTVDHASLTLAPALAEFARRHPRLTIDLRTSDRVVDMIEQGLDLAIRLGWLKDSSLRAIKLGEFQQMVVASPAYLRRAGRPAGPHALAQIEWIALGLLPTPLTWRFSGPDGQVETVQVKAHMRVDSPSALRALLQAGAGVSVLDQYNAGVGIADGSLVRVLPEWSLPPAGIYAVLPPGRQLPAKLRAFIDFYQDYLNGLAAASGA